MDHITSINFSDKPSREPLNSVRDGIFRNRIGRIEYRELDKTIKAWKYDLQEKDTQGIQYPHSFVTSKGFNTISSTGDKEDKCAIQLLCKA